MRSKDLLMNMRWRMQERQDSRTTPNFLTGELIVLSLLRKTEGEGRFLSAQEEPAEFEVPADMSWTGSSHNEKHLVLSGWYRAWI